MTVLRGKDINIGVKSVRHARYTVLQMAKFAVLRELFKDILRRI